MTKSCVFTICSSFKFLSLAYNSFGGCSGESAEVGKYAGAGAILSLEFDAILTEESEVFWYRWDGKL